MITTALFGSGVSYLSQIPGIKLITEKVLSGENVGREADLIYYLSNGQKYLKHHVKENIVLINHIKNDIQAFYNRVQENHEVNYEDIYYVLKQIGDSFGLEYENPGINSLIEKLELIDEFSKNRLPNIVNEAINYIQCIVWQMISYRNFSFDQFNIVPQLICDLKLSNIFSLNHDIVLDTYLQQNEIEYTDGFKHTKYKYPQWVGFENNNSSLKLYKLHGSVDWFEVLLKDRTSTELVKLPNNIYIQAVYREEEAFSGTADGTPKLLIGTFNKMLGYLSGIFETLYDAFKIKLKETNILIVSGYGFADKGINTQLSYWLNLETSHKMIIIHPCKEELIQKSRGNFRLNFINAYSKHPKIEFIQKRFEEVDINEITEAIERRENT